MTIRQILNVENHINIKMFELDFLDVPLNTLFYGLSLKIDELELFQKGKITVEEKEKLDSLIITGDIQNLKIVKQILIGKK